MMMHSVITPAPSISAMGRIVTLVARRWRLSRDRGQPVQHRLHAFLSARDWDMLTPAFHSLILLWEHAMQRPLATGRGRRFSGDEHMLVALLDGSVQRGACIPCPATAGRPLDAAIGSTRLLMATILSAPIGTGA
ncbi:hypothetical protein [Novosphingobium resinovorum]|uniref:hypothetical protein n=1 Tax=Novosphingobium resinovorum TaxID=158500 RepID=UPI002ED65695|nr:hypothetical protein [Novosphingobium resinovorum]